MSSKPGAGQTAVEIEIVKIKIEKAVVGLLTYRMTHWRTKNIHSITNHILDAATKQFKATGKIIVGGRL